MGENSLSQPTALGAPVGTWDYLFQFSSTEKKVLSLSLSSSFAKFMSGGTKGKTEKKSRVCEENMTFANNSEGHYVIILK